MATKRNRRSKPAAPALRTLRLTMTDGSQKKITIPRDWTVTFGPLAPGSKDGSLNSRGATCLRIYEGKSQQAVFTDVASFRDTSIVIEEQIIKVETETFYKGEGEERKEVQVEGRVMEWRNPDAPGAKEMPTRSPIDPSMRLIHPTPNRAIDSALFGEAKEAESTYPSHATQFGGNDAKR